MNPLENSRQPERALSCVCIILLESQNDSDLYKKIDLIPGALPETKD